MKWGIVKERTKGFFKGLYYAVLLIVLFAVGIAVFYGVNWAISWAGCWLLYSQYPPPNMVDSFNVIPDHFELGAPYLYGWITFIALFICAGFVVTLFQKYLSKHPAKGSESSDGSAEA